MRHWVHTQNIRKTNISYPLIRTLTCAYQKVRKVSFSNSFAYTLNEWSLWVIEGTWRLLHFLTNFIDNVPILYPLQKAPENIWFSGIFEWHKMEALARNVSNLLLSHIILGLSRGYSKTYTLTNLFFSPVLKITLVE